MSPRLLALIFQKKHMAKQVKDKRKNSPVKIRWYEKIITQTLFVVFIAALCVFAATVYIYKTVSTQNLESFETTTRENLKTHLESVVNHIDHAIHGKVRTINTLASSLTLRHLSGKEPCTEATSTTCFASGVREEMLHMQNTDPAWRHIDYVDTNSTVLASTRHTSPETIDLRFLDEKHVTVEDVKVFDIMSHHGAEKSIAIVSPVYHTSTSTTRDKKILEGYIIGHISPQKVFSPLEKFTKDKGVAGKVSYYVFSDKDVLLHKNTTDNLTDEVLNKISELHKKNIHKTISSSIENASGDVPKQYYIHTHSLGYNDFPGLGWSIVIETDISVAHDVKPILTFKNVVIFVCSILFAAVFTLGYVVFFIIRPIDNIDAQLKKSVLKGKMTALTTKQRGDLGMIVYGYNMLVTQIHERTERLKKTLYEAHTLNKELRKTKKATLNILEDLDEEKRLVDEKVKKRTSELQAEKWKLSHITESMHVGVILINNNNEPVFVNQKGKTMLDINNDISDAVTKLRDFFPNHKEVESMLHSCALGKSKQLPEVENEHGIFEITFMCDTEIKKHTDNGFTGRAIWIRDITDEKQLERSKSELVATASHQLRTPLTVARANLEMMLDGSFGKINKKQKELLSDSQESVIRLIGMVNDMLDITKIEKGAIGLTLENVDVMEPVTEVIENLKNHAEKHGISITLTPPPEPIIVHADRNRLAQVFQNLIENAIKYGKKDGEISISFTRKEDKVQISITDDGIGIPQVEQAGIFKRFYRASNAIRFSSGGSSGLGLSIVKSYIKQMGGSITFYSKEDVGTTFDITLPLTKDV